MPAISKLIGSPEIQKAFPLKSRLTGKTLKANIFRGNQLTQIPSYWEGYDPPAIKDSVIESPCAYVLVDRRNIVQSYSVFSLDSQESYVHLSTLYSGPWNLREDHPFFGNRKTPTQTLASMRNQFAVKGAGRAQLAWMIEYALSLLQEKRSDDPMIWVTPAYHAETFYEMIGFEKSVWQKPRFALTWEKAMEFLDQYQENPFFT